MGHENARQSRSFVDYFRKAMRGQSSMKGRSITAMAALPVYGCAAQPLDDEMITDRPNCAPHRGQRASLHYADCGIGEALSPWGSDWDLWQSSNADGLGRRIAGRLGDDRAALSQCVRGRWLRDAAEPRVTSLIEPFIVFLIVGMGWLDKLGFPAGPGLSIFPGQICVSSLGGNDSVMLTGADRCQRYRSS
jgi:hypothetical protein